MPSVGPSAVALVPLLDEHVPLVERWLSEDHVVRWGNRREAAILNLRDASRRDGQRLICLGPKPVGFLQWSEIVTAEWTALGVVPPNGVLDVDILIGVIADVGRGIASAALTQLVETLEGRGLMATVSLANAAGRRTFAKVGFVETQHFYSPGAGRMVLVVRLS